jgi:pre-mRNA-splicing factor SYF2
LQSLNWTAEEVSAWQNKEEEKISKKDQGFTDYNQLAFRKYNRMVSSINPDVIKNLEPDSEDAKANLSSDVQKQIQVRAQFSKRRHFSGDEEITYINQRNLKFNQKIARAYDKYTQETKDSLERGSAL